MSRLLHVSFGERILRQSRQCPIFRSRHPPGIRVRNESVRTGEVEMQPRMSCIVQTVGFPDFKILRMPPSDSRPWFVQCRCTTSASLNALRRVMSGPVSAMDALKRFCPRMLYVLYSPAGDGKDSQGGELPTRPCLRQGGVTKTKYRQDYTSQYPQTEVRRPTNVSRTRGRSSTSSTPKK